MNVIKSNEQLWTEVEQLRANGAYKKVIELLQANKVQLLEDDPIKLVEIEVDCLQELNDGLAIEALIKAYREGRYISQVFADKLSELEAKEKKRKTADAHQEFTYAVIIDLLKPEVPFNKQQQILRYLAQTSALPYLKPLKKLLINPQNSEQQKFALLLLVKSELDEELTYTSLITQISITVNPIKLMPPLLSPIEQKIIHDLEVLTDNVTINQIAIDLFQQMSINLYPTRWQNSQLNYLYAYLEIEAQKMLNITGEEEEILKKYTISKSAYLLEKKLYQKIAW